MKIDFRSLGNQLTNLSWLAVRTFVATVLLLLLLGIVLAGCAAYVLRDQQWYYSTLAVTVILMQALVAGCQLGSRRALARAVEQGLTSFQFGRTLLDAVFTRMLGEGSRLTLGLEHLPLAQADDLLSRAVVALTGEADQGGLLRQRIQGALLEKVQTYTLARFRTEGAAHGGVDLLRMKAELERSIDDVLVRKLRRGLRSGTLLVLLGLPVLVALQTWLLLLVARSH